MKKYVSLFLGLSLFLGIFMIFGYLTLPQFSPNKPSIILPTFYYEGYFQNPQIRGKFYKVNDDNFVQLSYPGYGQMDLKIIWMPSVEYLKLEAWKWYSVSFWDSRINQWLRN